MMSLQARWKPFQVGQACARYHAPPTFAQFCRVSSDRTPGLDRPTWPSELRTIPAFEQKIGPAKAGATGAVPPGLHWACILMYGWD